MHYISLFFGWWNITLDGDPLCTSVNHQPGCGSRIQTKQCFCVARKIPVYTARAGNFICLDYKMSLFGRFLMTKLTEQLSKSCRPVAGASSFTPDQVNNRRGLSTEFTDLLSKFYKTSWVNCSSCFLQTSSKPHKTNFVDELHDLGSGHQIYKSQKWRAISYEFIF